MTTTTTLRATQVVLGSGEYGDVVLDLVELYAGRMLIQGMSGSGKSGAIRRVLEQTHGKVQQIIIDPEGEFATLREGFDDYIVAGRDGDVPADPKSAAMLARKVLDLGINVILDISELQQSTSKASSREQQQTFVKLFVESLVNHARRATERPWPYALVIVDEAHLFCPEGGAAVSATAIKDLCSLGRKRGLVPVLATQRISKLSKDAAAELATKLVGRTGIDIDKRRAGDDLGFRDAASRDALRDLQTRQFWGVGPALSPDPQLITIGDVQTSMPRAGVRQATPPPAPTDAVRAMLAQLADLPAEAAAEARTVEELRAENSRLKRELSAKPKPVQACDHEEELADLRLRVGVYEQQTTNARRELAAAEDQAANYQVQLSVLMHEMDWLPYRLGELVKQAIEDASNADKVGEPLTEVSDGENRPAATAPEKAGTRAARLNGASPAPAGVRHAGASEDRAAPRRTVAARERRPEEEAGAQGLTAPRQKIIDAIAAFEHVGLESVSRSVVAAFAGVSPTSGGYRNNLGALRSAGLILYPESSKVALSDAGRALVSRDVEPIRELGQLHDAWLNLLPQPRVRLVCHLIDIYPDDIDRAALAQACGVSVTSGGYRNNLGALRSLGLIEYSREGFVRATSLLFPEGVPA